jgi:anti-anti-sigma factor
VGIDSTAEGISNQCSACGSPLGGSESSCPQCGKVFPADDDVLHIAPKQGAMLTPVMVDRFAETAARRGVRRVVVDCASIRYIDSAALGQLIRLKKRLGSSGELVLVGLHPVLKDVFRTTRLDQVFEIADE